MGFNLEMVHVIKCVGPAFFFFFFFNQRMGLHKARGLPHEIGLTETDEIAAA